MKLSGLERLTDLLVNPVSPPGEPDRAQPATSYEETTRQMVRDVEDDVRSLRRRLDALLFMVLSAILVEAASRLFGG